MKKLFYVLSISLLSLQCFSQMEIPKPDEAVILKNVPLLVELKTRNEQVIERLSKKKNDELQKYFSEIESYNIALRKVFEKDWTFSNEVKFVTDVELEAMDENKMNKGKYACFRKETKEGKSPHSMSKMKFSSAHDQTYFSLSIFGKGVVESMLYSDDSSSEADVKFVVQQFQNSLTLAIRLNEGIAKKQIKEEFKTNALKIKDKILLITKNNLDESLIEKINEIYPYKYKITSKEEINEAITNNTLNVAYLKVLPFKHVTYGTGVSRITKILYAHYIVNSEDGELLYLEEPRAFTAMGESVFGTLSKFDIKSIAKAVEAK